MGERVPIVSLVASTYGDIVLDSAVCLDATQTRTRVLASPCDARQLRGTFRVDHTLRSAVRRHANHIWLAVADAPIPHNLWWHEVAATRVWIAGVCLYRLYACAW